MSETSSTVNILLFGTVVKSRNAITSASLCFGFGNAKVKAKRKKHREKRLSSWFLHYLVMIHRKALDLSPGQADQQSTQSYS